MRCIRSFSASSKQVWILNEKCQEGMTVQGHGLPPRVAALSNGDSENDQEERGQCLPLDADWTGVAG